MLIKCVSGTLAFKAQLSVTLLYLIFAQTAADIGVCYEVGVHGTQFQLQSQNTDTKSSIKTFKPGLHCPYSFIYNKTQLLKK